MSLKVGFTLINIGILMLTITLMGAWRLISQPQRPAQTFISTGPTITELQAQGDLVTLKVTVGDVLEAKDGTFQGAWLVKGDSLIAVDLRKAKLKSTNEENRQLTIRLPNPRAISPRLDHEKTKTYKLERSTIFAIPGWGNDGPLRDNAMKEAQRLVHFACSRSDILEQARSNAVLMIRGMYRMANYEVEVEWMDEGEKFEEKTQ